MELLERLNQTGLSKEELFKLMFQDGFNTVSLGKIFGIRRQVIAKIADANKCAQMIIAPQKLILKRDLEG